MLNDRLKTANVNVHVIATGAGAGIQQALWETPGSSSYLSGGSFPYRPEETEELLGFKPKSWASQDTAIDLASAAYMKAFSFGGKNPIGVGLTASVASETEHRGDHRCHICLISNDRVDILNHILVKGVGAEARLTDGKLCDAMALAMLNESLDPVSDSLHAHKKDFEQLALDRFLEHPFFGVDGTRHTTLPNKRYALMSGAYNPPHEGHYGIQNTFESLSNRRVVYEITANPPHKTAVSVQELLQRASMLRGHDRFFTWSKPMYLDKARAYPGVPLVLGADAMLRILDPKWGVDPVKAIEEFHTLGTEFYVNGRVINGAFISASDIMHHAEATLDLTVASRLGEIMHTLEGRYDISSTELRSKVAH